MTRSRESTLFSLAGEWEFEILQRSILRARMYDYFPPDCHSTSHGTLNVRLVERTLSILKPKVAKHPCLLDATPKDTSESRFGELNVLYPYGWVIWMSLLLWKTFCLPSTSTEMSPWFLRQCLCGFARLAPRVDLLAVQLCGPSRAVSPCISDRGSSEAVQQCGDIHLYDRARSIVCNHGTHDTCTGISARRYALGNLHRVVTRARHSHQQKV